MINQWKKNDGKIFDRKDRKIDVIQLVMMSDSTDRSPTMTKFKYPHSGEIEIFLLSCHPVSNYFVLLNFYYHIE